MCFLRVQLLGGVESKGSLEESPSWSVGSPSWAWRCGVPWLDEWAAPRGPLAAAGHGRLRPPMRASWPFPGVCRCLPCSPLPPRRACPAVWAIVCSETSKTRLGVVAGASGRAAAPRSLLPAWLAALPHSHSFVSSVARVAPASWSHLHSVARPSGMFQDGPWLRLLFPWGGTFPCT